MKITVNADISPEEMRRLLGLPDVTSFQQEIMDQIKEKMKAGVEGYDPMSLYQPFVTNAFTSMNALQKFLTGAMTTYSDKQTSED